MLGVWIRASRDQAALASVNNLESLGNNIAFFRDKASLLHHFKGHVAERFRPGVNPECCSGLEGSILSCDSNLLVIDRRAFSNVDT